MSWERPHGPRGYDWSFVALEYYALILNRTYKVFVKDDLVAGAIVRGWLYSPPIPGSPWFDPEFYPRQRILKRYNGIDIQSHEFARRNYWNFQFHRSEIADVEFTRRPKWGMGNVPYSGRIILFFRRGGSKELILLGNQDGPTIRDRLAPLVAGARLSWWQQWMRRPTPEMAPGTSATPSTIVRQSHVVEAPNGCSNDAAEAADRGSNDDYWFRCRSSHCGTDASLFLLNTRSRCAEPHR